MKCFFKWLYSTDEINYLKPEIERHKKEFDDCIEYARTVEDRNAKNVRLIGEYWRRDGNVSIDFYEHDDNVSIDFYKMRAVSIEYVKHKDRVLPYTVIGCKIKDGSIKDVAFHVSKEKHLELVQEFNRVIKGDSKCVLKEHSVGF
jgi:hypothetical protein